MLFFDVKTKYQMKSVSTLIYVLSFVFLSQNVKALNTENIIGGCLGRIQRYPYVVELIVTANNVEYHCTGGIISEQHVLSAAHCLVIDGVKELNNVMIVGGVSDLNEVSTYKVQYKAIEFFFVENFFDNDLGVYRDDIVVLKLREVFDFVRNPNVRPIHLPSENLNYTGNIGTLASFGADILRFENDDVNPIVTSSGKLNYVRIEVLPIEDSEYDMVTIHDGQFYGQVYPNDEYRGVCDGDSGALVVKRHKQGRKNIIGLLSTGPTGCNEEYVGSVYTNVPYYRNFIQKALDGICDESFMSCYSSNQ